MSGTSGWLRRKRIATLAFPESGNDRSTTTRLGANFARASIIDRSSATISTLSNNASSRPCTPPSRFRWLSANTTRPYLARSIRLDLGVTQPSAILGGGRQSRSLRESRAATGMVSRVMGPTPLGELLDSHCALRSAGGQRLHGLGSSHRDQSIANRILDQIRRRVEFENFQDASSMKFRRARRNPQDGRHFLGGTTFGQQLQDFPLTRGKPVPSVVRPRTRFPVGL